MNSFIERFDKTKRLLEKNKLRYDAKFSGGEVQAVTNVKGRQDKFQPDPYQMEVEAETDRLFLCEKLLEQKEASQARNAIGMNESGGDQLGAPGGGRAPPAIAAGPAGAERNGIAEDEDKIFVTTISATSET